MRILLNWLSHLLGLDIEFDAFGVFLFAAVVVLPLVMMGAFVRLARKYQRSVWWVAAVPIVWWVVPGVTFALREPLDMPALPLLGIALACAGLVGVFVLVGGNEAIKESQGPAKSAKP